MGKKRICALLLALCFVLPLVQTAACAADRKFEVTICTGVREKPEAEVSVQWNDAWFAGDAAEYRHELALTAMALSAAAYVRTDDGVSAQEALEAFGFGRIKSCNYEFAEQSSERTAYTFAVKTVKDQKGKPAELVAVVIRGTGEYTEWAGNLNVGTGAEHAGFAKARDELMANLEQYLTEAGVQDTAKFFITGHSRGGAAANLVAARLLDEKKAERQDVYAYTFAAPAVSTEAKYEGYESIFNIVNPCDLVTQVPLAKWGYSRYGTDRLLPAGTDGEEERFAAMEKQYESLTGRSYTSYQDGTTVEQLTGTLYRLAPSVSGPNMAMLSALLRGDLDSLSALVEGNALAALTMARTAIQASSELVPLLQQESAGLAAAHCMAGYWSWLAACPEAQ